jgi:iron complex transport system ATP-binding protein
MRTRNQLKLHTRYRISAGTLVIDLGRPGRILSSAPQRGGLRQARYILNHQVKGQTVSDRQITAVEKPTDSDWDDPARYLNRVATELGVDDTCVGLMTAVPMNQLVVGREESEGIWVECFATVGITNAVRAGEWPRAVSGSSKVTVLGTINLILITNATLSNAAMVGAAQVATESKTGILRDHDVPSWTGVSGATGTGTDVVVVACRRREKGRMLSYSGTHTVIGAMIGRVVASCVTTGLARAERWTAQAASRSRSVSR